MVCESAVSAIRPRFGMRLNFARRPQPVQDACIGQVNSATQPISAGCNRIDPP